MTASAAPASARSFPFFSLLVITGAVFVSVSSEFLPTGLLPQIADELKVSDSQVGLLITVFAGTVVLSTAPLTVLTRRFSRKWLMVALLAGFALTNLLCALAPEYWMLLCARILGGLCHGLFWAVTGPYASLLVPKAQLSRALAIVNVGGTLAFVLGVPVGTAIGIALGWRLAFAVMGVVVLVFALLVVLFLPSVNHLAHLDDLRTGELELPVRRDRTVPAVLAVCALVIVIVMGQNTFYTYISPWLDQVAHFPSSAVGPLLFVYGAAGAVGLLVAGVLGDRLPRATPWLLLGLMIVGVVTLGAGGGVSPVIAIAGLVLWSIGFGGLPASFHSRLLHTASARIRDVAAAWLTTSFNIAIGVGALLGAGILRVADVAVLPWVMVAFLLGGLAVLGATSRTRPGR